MLLFIVWAKWKGRHSVTMDISSNCGHTYTHTVSAYLLEVASITLTKPHAPSNQQTSTKIHLLPKIKCCHLEVSRQDDNDDLADKLEYGGAKTIQLPLEILSKILGVKNNGCGVAFVPGFQNEQGVC